MTNWGAAMVFNPYGLFFTETDEEKAFVSSPNHFSNQVLVLESMLSIQKGNDNCSLYYAYHYTFIREFELS